MTKLIDTSESRVGKALILAILYTAVIGIGMYITKHINGVTYGDVTMVETLWWVEIILTALAVGFTMKWFSWSGVGFGKLQASQLLWLAFPFAVIIYTWWQISSIATAESPWKLIALICFTTLLVGFSEELVYRGFALRAFMQRMPLWLAMLVSSVLFGLLHSVNYFAGLTPELMAQQVFNTFILGLFAAPMILRQNSLWPMIIFHWQWDFVLLTMTLFPEVLENNVAGLVTFYTWPAIVILWFLVLRTKKN